MVPILWPKGVVIDVLGLTGPYASGKTVFGLSIAPGVHPEGHPFAGQPRTRYDDLEKSGATYQGFGAYRMDWPTEMVSEKMRAKYTRGVRPIDIFQEWYSSIKTIKPGQYDVIMADTIGDLEGGMVDWVKSRHKEFGFKSAESFEAMGGIFWKYVKDEWKLVLSYLSSICQTFVFTAHLRKVWVNGRPTSQFEPVGKDTLMELSSLYLWMDRSANAKGEVPEKPAANLRKNRLMETTIDANGDVVTRPYLPPRLPVATPKALREYILAPPSYEKLKPAEKVHEKQLSEEEQLLIRQNIAEAEAQKEQTALERLNRQVELQQMAQRNKESAKPNVDMTAQEQAARTVKTASHGDAKPKPESEAPSTIPLSQTSGAETRDSAKAPAELVARIVDAKQRLGMPMATFQAGIKKITKNSENPLDLTLEQAEGLLAQFLVLLDKRKAG